MWKNSLISILKTYLNMSKKSILKGIKSVIKLSMSREKVLILIWDKQPC